MIIVNMFFVAATNIAFYGNLVRAVDVQLLPNLINSNNCCNQTVTEQS